MPTREPFCETANHKHQTIYLRFFFFNSASMASLKSGIFFLVSSLPLMKTEGVPVLNTLIWRPLFRSRSIKELIPGSFKSSLNFSIFKPSPRAISSTLESESPHWLANSFSCISQNLPCLFAAMAAMAACLAKLWPGRGKCFMTNRTSFG